ncbi:MAG: hypothetical protein ACO2PN_11170 [Pyrobaculum sp.]|jgi:hypothetical protein
MATTAFILSEFLKEIDVMKRKYHESTMTADAEWTNYLRFLNMYDMFIQWSSFIIPEFAIDVVAIITTFGISPFEFDVFTLVFDVKLPSLDEYLKGVNIVIDKIPIEIALSKLGIPLDLLNFLDLNFNIGIPEIPIEKVPQKCVYGEGTYGNCYVDPDTMREFIRNTILAIFKKHRDIESARRETESLADALGISRDVIATLFNRIVMLRSYYRNAFTLNVSSLNIATLSNDETKVSVYTFDAEVKEVEVRYLTDALMGCMLDLNALDLCYVMREGSAFKADLDPTRQVPPILDSIQNMVRDNVSRYLYTPMALANYATGRERADYRFSQRTETWAQQMALRFALDAYVESVLPKLLPDTNKFMINVYATAVRQLFGHLYKRHKWGMDLWTMLSDEELKTYWVSYWTSQGLDPDVLNKIYDKIKDILPHLARRKYELGRSVRWSRLLRTID